MAYKGLIVPLNIGFQGFTGTRNPVITQPGKLIEASDITFEGGLLQKEGGATKYNSSAISGTPDILGGWDWHPTGTSTKRMIVLTSAGDLLKDSGDGTFPVTLASGITVSADTVPVFVEGGVEAAGANRLLFIFIGTDTVEVLAADGATTGALSNPAADWAANNPTFGFMHADGGTGAARLWAGGNSNDPHRIYYTDFADHDDFVNSPAGSISIYPGVGEKLVGGVSWRGVAVLFKRKGIYLLDTLDITNPDLQQLSTSVGAAGPLAILPIENDILFMSPTGSIHALSAVQKFGDAETSNLTAIEEVDEWIRRNVNLAKLHLTRSIWYPSKREAHFCVAATGSTELNRRIILDLSQPGNVRFRISKRDTIYSIWTRDDSDGVPRPVYGDGAGFVRLMDQDGRALDGVAYRSVIQSTPDDLTAQIGDVRAATKNKNGQFLELIAAPADATSINVQIWWDENYHETVSFVLSGTGSSLPVTLPFTLGGGRIIRQKKKITGSGRTISLKIDHEDTANFALAQFYLHFTLGDERFIGS